MSEAILNILGDCWEKFICSSLPARLMKRFPASKGHPQPDLLGSFPADVGHRAKFSPSGGGRGLIGNWVWPKGYIHPFRGDGVGGGGERLRGFWQIAHSSYPTHQITSDTHNFPISKDILFCPNLPASKNLPEEQIFWGTDPLGAPENDCKTSKTLDITNATSNLPKTLSSHFFGNEIRYIILSRNWAKLGNYKMTVKLRET